MKYTIRGINVEVTEALKGYVEKKISRVERYFDAPIESEAHVLFSILKEGHKVEVTIPCPGLLVRAEECSEDMYASIDLVAEKLERQIRKYKTRVNRKIRQESSPRVQAKISAGSPVMSTATVEADEEAFSVVRNKRFDFKPMGTEEAILQMDMLGHSFYVFSNATTDQVNVIYRRKDGKYGLIEPE